MDHILITMALFNKDDISYINASLKDQRRHHFSRDCENEINCEMNFIENYIRENKSSIMESLIQNYSTTRTSQTIIQSISSFDFSKVHANSCYTFEYVGSIFDGTFNSKKISFKEHAEDLYPDSFVEHNSKNMKINKFSIWKSLNFLSTLESRLCLPENIHFRIVSHQKFNNIFGDNKDVRVFDTKLVMVYKPNQ